jgi:ketosteroid isomerase-like protein
MSQENVEVVRSIYRAVERGDYSSSEWADPDIEFVAPHEERPLRGVEAMQRSWRDFLSAWKDFKAEPEEIIDAGEQVLVLEKVGGRGHGSGAPAEGLRSASLFTLREGRVVRLVQYTNRAEAFEAAGLGE